MAIYGGWRKELPFECGFSKMKVKLLFYIFRIAFINGGKKWERSSVRGVACANTWNRKC